MGYLWAFLVGGAICAIVQIFIDKTKLMPGRIMVGLVVIGAILGAVGIYQPLIDFAGAGAGVPLLSFGNSLIKGVQEAVDSEGLLGLFTGGFKAGAVGCSAALIWGYIAALVFNPKMKQ
ncbi:MAG: stage V sporulation protein AE [Lachnospiraceae bacterium]